MNTRIDALLPGILRWLDAAHAPALPPADPGWSAADWELARQAVFMHGISPFLHEYFMRFEENRRGNPTPARDRGQKEAERKNLGANTHMQKWEPANQGNPAPARDRSLGEASTAAAAFPSADLSPALAKAPLTTGEYNLSWLYAEKTVGFRQYLADEHARNAARLRRVQTRLAEILADAHHAGIAVLPLKGSLLIAQGAFRWRVMADIDLLIHPQDRLKFRETMEKRGDRYEPPDTVLSHHEEYHQPGEQVVRWDGEDAGNPLPIEVHHGLRRVLWGRFPSPDLTEVMWASAQPGEIFGAPSWLPDPEIHEAFLALHALSHFLVNRGRVAHWLDLAYTAPSIGRLERLPEIGILYPILRLAARALPRWFESIEVQAVGRQVHPAIREWAERIPLDQRCGLQDHAPNRREKFVARWLPTPMRLALVYGNTPLPVALGRYLFEPARHSLEKAAWNRRRQRTIF